jgi:phytoene dehydrogenase-like protein
MRDVVVIGAGYNGLVAASVLAKTGLKTLLERTDRVGSCARTSETRGFGVRRSPTSPRSTR